MSFLDIGDEDDEPSTALVERPSQELVEALEQLTPSQAQFLECLVECREF